MYYAEIERKKQITNRLKWICLARDGAYAQINSTPELLLWNLPKSTNMLWMKYAGGCSMTQSPNDLGASHTIMHEQFSSPHFRYADSIDPIGKPYEQLKEYLERYLDPSSFKTIWKFCCKSEEFVDRAFTISNVKSSFKSAGIFFQNLELRELPEGEAAFVLSSVQGFSAKIDEKGYICEDEVEQQFAGEELMIENWNGAQ